ncbi:hypothetical protein AOC36_08375 [Erysipelothrix larvae]|uniref:Nuclease SbcCD subunit C n=1 Tax=Erysipelothrix larvae TaxID=1514105 RepID=A0A0X8H0V0_9FIRM|nr:AAA family ATPase [Erysipelothrix larvae]AMC94001.1 hypothetical protein AOC36_08375 [Erysipelothrix larvae]
MTTQIDLKLVNIGPHKTIDFSKTLNNMRISIYARNGAGKTFISRCFNVFAMKLEDRNEYSKILLRYGQQSGNFSFNIGSNSASFRLSNNGIDNCQNLLDRKFHVFNNDYIIENFSEKEFIPNSNIEGIVLGKGNIDLSSEKRMLNSLLDEGNSLRSKIEENIVEAKSNLKKYKISNSLTKCKDINYTNIIEYKPTDVDYSVEVGKYSELSSLPDDIRDFRLDDRISDIGIEISDLKNLLKTKYTLNKFEADFREYVKTNLKFIELGLKLHEGNNCPFCKQNLSDNAFQLINQYVQFVNDEETKVNKMLIAYFDKFEEIRRHIDEYYRYLGEFEERIRYYNQFFGPFDLTSIVSLKTHIDEWKDLATMILERVKSKKQNITLDFDSTDITNEIIDKLANNIKQINMSLSEFNIKKNNIAKLKTEYRRSICEGLFNKLHSENRKLIDRIVVLRKNTFDLRSLILEKENTNQSNKKDLVANDLEKYLFQFFRDKYVLNKDDFTLTLKEYNINTSSNKALSEGEKSILAFCYFLASIHEVVSDTEEYNKIILVIDDPVSSMDIQYTYQLVALLKNYQKDIEGFQLKFIMLTHNLEFFNILSRNNLSKHKLILEDGLDEYKNEILMPYDYHLYDVWSVAKGKKLPSHTTPNSIRHIIETIAQFCGYGDKSSSLYNMICEKEQLNQNLEIYTFMQDLSHGNFRLDTAYTSDVLKEGAVAVINYVTKEFPKQLIQFSNESNQS